MTAGSIRREDYRPPDFRVASVELSFDIGSHTELTARTRFVRAGAADAPLALDGRDCELLSVELDGAPLDASRWERSATQLRIGVVPDRFELTVRTRLDPAANTALEGLYRSGSMLCTQCEAHGFSRMTYYPDRPDVLARFRVRIEADRATYPVLLSNGNLLEAGEAGQGRHFAVWEDPFPKPCYLFALVAGKLGCLEDTFVTASGRRVQLKFYVDPGDESRATHALESLKRAMRWDEQAYGLEYDLDTYMVVAARDFNMGAMENKGLNLFNAAYVLASPETATDHDYQTIEAVIGHEYFHNWTGNRVTCRDWFQLSLKEGLTVFREQQFSAAQGSPAVKRIQEVRDLRARQFREDAGPLAHPVRPEAYVEVNNFYTATVYEKGAELIRMIQTRIGPQRFAEGVREYLRRHDGAAATIEDFLAAHEAVSGVKLDGFRRWYGQAGTPRLQVRETYDAAAGTWTLSLQQQTPPTPGQERKEAVPIPIRFALWGDDGHPVAAETDSPLLREPGLLLLESGQAEVALKTAARPTASLLRGFSAPVRLDCEYSDFQLALLLQHDDDAVVRWDAAQQLMQRTVREALAGRRETRPALLRALGALVAQGADDRALLAELLRLPSAAELLDTLAPADPLAVADAHQALRMDIGRAFTGPLSVWAQWEADGSGASAIGRRALANLALDYLVAAGSERVLDLAERRAGSRNMTLRLGAMAALSRGRSPQRDAALAQFLAFAGDDGLLLDKWFALQAGSASVAEVAALLQHPRFEARNPNRVRAVLGAFARESLRGFHAPDGTGYRLLASEIARLDAGNPQLASRLTDALTGWRRLPPPQSDAMRQALATLRAAVKSDDVREKVEKALA